jgi:hypothetical protein
VSKQAKVKALIGVAAAVLAAVAVFRPDLAEVLQPVLDLLAP